jgi:hypothetical protein
MGSFCEAEGWLGLLARREGFFGSEGEEEIVKKLVFALGLLVSLLLMFGHDIDIIIISSFNSFSGKSLMFIWPV